MANKITNQLLQLKFIDGLRQNQRRMAELQNQIVTGRVINTPEDEPKAIGTVLLFDEQIARIEQHERNTELGRDFMDNSEGALGQLSAGLQRARELAVRAANGASTHQDRLAVREELFQLMDDALTVSNQRFGTKYLFGGTRTEVKPFTLNTGTLIATYNGNNRDVLAQIESGQTIAVNLPGDSGSGTGVFQTVFSAFKTVIDAINANDPTTLSYTSLTKFDAAVDSVAQSRTLLGARSNRMAINVERLQDIKISAQRFRSELQDLDIAEGITKLTSAETTFRAALAIGARVLQPSLLDFLR